jgi:dihydroxyacetone kinase-like protein
MQKTIPFERVRDALVAVADAVAEKRQDYNDQDSPIGDSDHGDSVCEAFNLVRKAAVEDPPGRNDIGELLKAAGKAVTFSGGAAMGPLYGTAFLDAGKAVVGLTQLSYDDLVRLWTAFAEGIARRGSVKIGEKTMYDTIRPAVDALQAAHAAGTPMPEACALVITAAEKGMYSTKDMLSLRGRSSRLGERSRGHIDPGAASMFTVLSVFFSTIKE